MSEPHERAERGPYISGLPGFVLKVERGHGWRRAAHAGFSGLGSLWRVRRTAPFLATFDFQCKPRQSRHLVKCLICIAIKMHGSKRPLHASHQMLDLHCLGLLKRAAS